MIIDVHNNSFACQQHGMGIGDCIQMLPVVQAIKNAAPSGARVRVVTREQYRLWVALGGFETCAIERLHNYPPADRTLWPYQLNATDTDLCCLAVRTNRQVLWAHNLGLQPATCTPVISPEARAWARDRYDEIAKGKRVCWISPFAANPNRTWHCRRWIQLALALQCKGFVVAGQMSRFDPPNAMWFPGTMFQDCTPDRTAALFQLADLYVGNDSGLTHLAGWLGVPSVAVCSVFAGRVVFGCYPSVRVVSAGAPCAPCVNLIERGFAPWCRYGCDALDAIPVAQVLAAVKEQLK